MKETCIVKTQALKKYYKLGANTVRALDGVDFEAVSYTHLVQEVRLYLSIWETSLLFEME